MPKIKPLGVRVEDVPRWVIRRGIGHVVRSWRKTTDPLTLAICGDLFVGEWEHTEDAPRRICRRCRDDLRTAFISTASEAAAGEGNGK